MKFRKEYLLLYAVTDGSQNGISALAEQVEAAIRGGVTMVQLRDKDRNVQELEQEALVIQRLCRKYQIPFLINDHVALARRIDADGVHIGQEDMAVNEARALLGRDKIIGVTAKTVEQALAAQEGGADYLGSGAVFGTATKPDARRLNYALLDQICDSVRIPVVAIGGIDCSNITALKGRKMDGVAVVRGLFGSQDIEGAARELRSLAEQILL